MADEDEVAQEVEAEEEEVVAEEEADEEAAEDQDVGDEGAVAEDPEEVGEEEHGDAEKLAKKDKGPPMIRNAWGKKVVSMRQKLKSEEEADKFVSQLQDAIEKAKAEGKKAVFEDFDISQNPIPTTQLESIFAAMTDSEVHVERFRAFGCATMDNVAVASLVGWLSGVTDETAPYELHLSDCAITTDGYRDLVKALEDNDAFPGQDPKNPSRGKLPLYVRLENNYIEPEAIQSSIDSGSVIVMTKNKGIKHSDTVKMRLLLTREGDSSFQQKTGEPPPPEEWPAPKPVRDGKDYKGSAKGKDSKGKGKDRDSDRHHRDREGKGYEWDRRDDRRGSDRWSDRAGGRSGAPWKATAALPAPSRSDRDSNRREVYREQPDRDRRPPIPRVSERDRGSNYDRRPPLNNPYSAFGARQTHSDRDAGRNYYDNSRNATRDRDIPRAAPRSGGGDHVVGSRAPVKRAPGYGGREADEPSRKRTRYESGLAPRDGREVRSPVRKPSGRAGSAGAGGPAPRPSKARGGGGLPPDWEEHFSDEYQLPYYWNRATGQSSWDKPAR